MRPPDKRSCRTGHPAARTTPDDTIAEGTTRIADHGDSRADPRAIGELLNTWLGIKVDQVDALVDDARGKVDALPDQRQLWLLFGEALVRLHVVELEVSQLRAEVGRLRQEGRAA
jgi:hypothetical protein